MPTNYICKFTRPQNVQSNGRMGGKFATPVWSAAPGPGIFSPRHGTPILIAQDSLQIVVVVPGNVTTPMTGSVIISAAHDASQAAPSPFFVPSNTLGQYLCFYPVTCSTPSFSQGQTTYTFPSTTYFGSVPGGYEMTFVAQDADGNQWSEDPEFDTGN